MFNLFQAANDCLGSYDEFPTMPAGTDPMPCLSRNRVAQPFHLVSASDEVLIAMAGDATLRLPGNELSEVPVGVGEAVYIPAGQPSQIIPSGTTIHLRFKPEPPDWEAAAWFCEHCGVELHRREFRAGEQLPQECYWDACQAFNRDERLRTCGQCATVTAPLDLSDIRWPDVAEMIRAGDEAAAAPRRRVRTP